MALPCATFRAQRAGPHHTPISVDTTTSERGDIALILVALIGLSLGLALIAGSSMLQHGAQRSWSLFDQERDSPLVCPETAESQLRDGAFEVAVPGGTTLPCLPRRLDYAAPGDHREATASAICVLRRWYRQAEGGVPCT